MGVFSNLHKFFFLAIFDSNILMTCNGSDLKIATSYL